VGYRAAAVVGTFVLVAVGLVLVRSESWPGCWRVQGALLGVGTVEGMHWVPVWVPVLVGMVAAGHLFSGLREVRCGLLEAPDLVRAAAYTAAVVLLVVFGPGAGKAFIYFQF
jgi:hypothetical protein